MEPTLWIASDPIAGATRTLREQGMPPKEIEAVLGGRNLRSSADTWSSIVSDSTRGSPQNGERWPRSSDPLQWRSSNAPTIQRAESDTARAGQRRFT